MPIYLSLGSNLGDRRENLRAALGALDDESVHVQRISPVVESPALLPPDAPADWNSPFLNLVAECSYALTPEALLQTLKRIEQALGRSEGRRWAPRPIDIDILAFGDAVIDTARLTIPHAGLNQRTFFLTPLAALAPGLELPRSGKTALELNVALGQQIPLWMGIVNLTPDSFSDGGHNTTWDAIEQRIDAMIASGVHILDFGAESTRPGAAPLTAEDEWSRLEATLLKVIDKYADDVLRPSISVDTYHAAVAARAIELGVDIINDVSGLTQPAMVELAATHETDFVAMHNLGLPADPGTTLATDSSAVDQVEFWLDRQLKAWQVAGLDLNRIVFDPGIGFGKNALQSLELLREIRRFRNKGLRLLVGHSRKSYLKSFAGSGARERDLATIGSSLALCQSGVDILRVHNVPDHVAAYRGWAHIQPPG
jgi:dihydropteroate synthase/2-amino-4-hydroxy-6-hydroxymethyldihydropteridine diphosphokinase